MNVQRFIVKMGFAPDLDMGEKTILRSLGKNVKKIEYTDFYKMFCKSIFRIALIDMLNNIEQLANHSKNIPLLIKIAAFRRSIILNGLNKNADPQLKTRGE